MISLSGLSAVPGGYQSAQANLLALAQKQAEQDAQTAYGQALQALAGQSGIPTAPQLPVTRQGLGAPIALPMPRLAPQQPAPPQVSNPLQDALRAKGLTNVQSTALTPPQAPAPARPPQAAQAPAASTAQPAQPQVNLPSAAGVQPGTLTWPAIVNAIKAANPKISPAALAGAVDKFMPLMQDTEAQKWKQISAQQDQQRLSQTASGAAGAYADSDISDLVDQIVDHKMPPPGAIGASMRYPSALNGRIAIEMARRKLDVAANVADWNAFQGVVKAQNSPITQRNVAAIDSAGAFLDKFKQNIDSWGAAGLPAIINKTVFDQVLAGNVPGGDQKKAALIAQSYSDLINLLSSVFSAGGVPTDYGRKLAKEQLDLGWSQGTTDAVIEQLQGFLAERKNAIRGVQPFTPGSSMPNAYSGSAGSAGQPAPDGTVVQMQDGSYQMKQGGKWGPY